MYTKEDVQRAMQFVRGYGFDTEIKLNGNTSIQLLANGHIAGSASIYLTYTKNEYVKKRVLYTGDHSYGKEKPFTTAWHYDGLKADLIITESTYASVHNEKYNNPTDELERYIMEECVQQGKVLFMPVFAIGRSTELIYMLKTIWDRNPRFREANIPISFASPMLAKAHRIIGKPSNYCFYDDKWLEYIDIFKWDGVNFIEKYKDVEKKLFNDRCRIVGASSGMLCGGYGKALLHSYLPNKKVDFLFSGYCGEGTNARKILDGEQKSINVDNKPVRINATILGILNGMSSHADDSGLRGLIGTCEKKKIKKIAIIHGDLERQEILKKELEIDVPNAEILIPKYQEIIKI
jgi:Cft2 family RNA processing exonuclease